MTFFSWGKGGAKRRTEKRVRSGEKSETPHHWPVQVKRNKSKGERTKGRETKSNKRKEKKKTQSNQRCARETFESLSTELDKLMNQLNFS